MQAARPWLEATAARISMRKLLPCLLLICVAAVPPLLPADTVIEEIIARINNQIVRAPNTCAAKNR